MLTYAKPARGETIIIMFMLNKNYSCMYSEHSGKDVENFRQQLFQPATLYKGICIFNCPWVSLAIRSTCRYPDRATLYSCGPCYPVHLKAV